MSLIYSGVTIFLYIRLLSMHLLLLTINPCSLFLILSQDNAHSAWDDLLVMLTSNKMSTIQQTKWAFVAPRFPLRRMECLNVHPVLECIGQMFLFIAKHLNKQSSCLGCVVPAWSDRSVPHVKFNDQGREGTILLSNLLSQAI